VILQKQLTTLTSVLRLWGFEWKVDSLVVLVIGFAGDIPTFTVDVEGNQVPLERVTCMNVLGNDVYAEYRGHMGVSRAELRLPTVPFSKHVAYFRSSAVLLAAKCRRYVALVQSVLLCVVRASSGTPTAWGEFMYSKGAACTTWLRLVGQQRRSGISGSRLGSDGVVSSSRSSVSSRRCNELCTPYGDLVRMLLGISLYGRVSMPLSSKSTRGRPGLLPRNVDGWVHMQCEVKACNIVPHVLFVMQGD